MSIFIFGSTVPAVWGVALGTRGAQDFVESLFAGKAKLK
jgi:hypothetical protein